MEIFADVRVRRQVRELLIEMQRAMASGKKPTLPVMREGRLYRDPIELFDRPPGLPDIVEKAILEFREKYQVP